MFSSSLSDREKATLLPLFLEDSQYGEGARKPRITPIMVAPLFVTLRLVEVWYSFVVLGKGAE